MGPNEESTLIEVSRAPIDRVCRECGEPFVITIEEQEFFARMQQVKPIGSDAGAGWNLPKRCTECRWKRRAAKHAMQPSDDDGQDEWIICALCGEGFIFGGRDKVFFAARGFTKPKRCRPCRESLRTLR